MDIKWKSNPKKQRLITVVLTSLVVATMVFYPGIIRRGERMYENYVEQRAEGLNSADKVVLEQIYIGCYVLYKESKEWEGQSNTKASDLFFEFSLSHMEKSIQNELITEFNEGIEQFFDSWASLFETYREHVDYCVLGDNGRSNTSRPLEQAASGNILNSDLTSYYKEIFQIQFNENGVMEVQTFLSKDSNEEDMIIKELGRIDRKELLKTMFLDYFGEYSDIIQIKKPQNFTVIFAFPRRNEMTELNVYMEDESLYWYRMDSYMESGAQALYAAVAVLLVLFVFYMGSRKVWGDEVMVNRPGNWYLMEVAIISIIAVLGMGNFLVEIIWKYNYYDSFTNFFGAIWSRGIYEAVLPIIQTGIILFLVYTLWYFSISFIRPVFLLGIREYIRQYSFFYQIFPWTKRKWSRFMNELQHIDFAEKTTNVIFKVVFINFIFLSLISSFWFWGIAVLFIYSVVLFYFIRRYYDKVRKDYRILLQGVSRIAQGDLNTVITEDLGIFEPFRNELVKIRTGFKKAVDNEVKSQRMKTELITNISHDLKTPLTAITTYIELLKKEDITEKEHKSYIETLEKKSQRLKVLIEDLFEISKLSSNNIVLNLMELDVVNLMKQVIVEYAERFQEYGIEFRWNVPDDKIMLKLDNQKTYRIFENLFVNLYKYAMHYSRVYIHVNKSDNNIAIVIKNISAVELNISAEEITERFVRGDNSRTTEGSGLGLAIAKSLTEAQGGTFDVEIDGDLFKVIIGFLAI